MPSGKTHDIITFALAAPVSVAGLSVSGSLALAVTLTGSFLFGGLMFGPDLDTVSKQYSRWKLMRPVWLPYRTAFKHRSRWSHGLIFGTLFRVVYFMGILSLGAYVVFVLNQVLVGGEGPQASNLVQAWAQMGRYVRGELGEYFLPAVFGGMWAGAASHTFTDMAATYVKTGRVMEFL